MYKTFLGIFGLIKILVLIEMLLICCPKLQLIRKCIRKFGNNKHIHIAFVG